MQSPSQGITFGFVYLRESLFYTFIKLLPCGFRQIVQQLFSKADTVTTFLHLGYKLNSILDIGSAILGDYDLILRFGLFYIVGIFKPFVIYIKGGFEIFRIE
ncbi:hypothetical protein D3C85_1517830 [compost metagenome]